jgi:RHS repeat-associated protein
MVTAPIGRMTATGTVTLPTPAPSGGATVTLSSSDTSVLTVARERHGLRGSKTATFIVTTYDVAGATTVMVTATYGAGSATAQVTVQSVDWKIASLSFDPVATYPWSRTTTGTIMLAAAAPAGGARVLLQSAPGRVWSVASGSSVFTTPIPDHVDVAAGATTVTFTATGGSDPQLACFAPGDCPSTIMVTATLGASRQAAFTYHTEEGGILEGLTVSVPRLIGGALVRATVHLVHPAPAGGVVVTITSSDAAMAGVPSTVRVRAGSRTAELTIRTARTGHDRAVEIRAAVARVQRSATITLVPTALLALAPPSEIAAGDSAEGRITLSDPAPEGGVVVTLSSSDPSLTLPSHIAINADETVATFRVQALPVLVETDVQVTVAMGDSRSAMVRVTPSQQPTILFIVAAPERLVAGETATVIVTLATPAPGEGVNVILAADADTVEMPANLRMPEGATSGSFGVVTSSATTATSITISATVGRTTRTVRIGIDGKRRPSRSGFWREFGLGRAESGSLSLGVQADFVAPRTGTLSMTSVRRYSFHTPEMNLMSESNVIAASSPAIAYDYIWFGGKPVAEVDVATSTTHWTFTDHLGTPLLQTTASATIDWRVEHEPFGKVRTYRTGATRHQPLRFPGQEHDEESLEREYNIFRWYRAGWGKYSQADPFGLRGGANLYGYSNDSPVVAVDPLGLAIWLCSRKSALGFGSNHAYLWDDRKGTLPDKRSCGEGDASGHESGPQMPGMQPGTGDQCNLVPNSDGKEEEILSCCESLRKSKKVWAPGYDCFWLAGHCIEEAGLHDPGAPGGRLGSPCCGNQTSQQKQGPK